MVIVQPNDNLESIVYSLHDREEEFFMWIIFFENNGGRMFVTCAYPGFGDDYVSRGFL